MVAEEAGINLAEVARLIEEEKFIAIEKVPSQSNHPGQMMFVVLLDEYAHCVPFVIEDDGNIFIKTVFASRKLNAKYNNNKGEGYEKK